MIEVLHHGIQVHFQYRLMHLLLQLLGDIIETKGACSLYQNHLVPKSLKHIRPKKLIHIPKEKRYSPSGSSHRSRQFCCLASSCLASSCLASSCLASSCLAHFSR